MHVCLPHGYKEYPMFPGRVLYNAWITVLYITCLPARPASMQVYILTLLKKPTRIANKCKVALSSSLFATMVTTTLGRKYDSFCQLSWSYLSQNSLHLWKLFHQIAYVNVRFRTICRTGDWALQHFANEFWEELVQLSCTVLCNIFHSNFPVD